VLKLISKPIKKTKRQNEMNQTDVLSKII